MRILSLTNRMGADECEEVRASISAGYDRNQESLSAQPITAWIRFTFPGRKGKYSDFQWD